MTTIAPGNTFLLNTGDGTRLVRLVAQDGQPLIASGLTTTRVIPAAKAAPVIGTPTVVGGMSVIPAVTPSPTPIRTSTPNVATSAVKPTLHSYSTPAPAPSTATGTKAPNEGMVTLSSKNVMVSIKDKLAYFHKKDETTGEYKTVGPVDKETLVRKLQVYQQQSKGPQEGDQSDASASTSTAVTPKPVCSVAPVRQPPQQPQLPAASTESMGATSTPMVRPVLQTTPKPVSSFGGQTVLVSGGQQVLLLPSQQPQVITIAGSGSYILTSNQAGSATPTPGPIYLAAPASTATGHAESTSNAPSTPGVQLIQVMPQIILNSAAPASSQPQVVQRPASQQQHVQIGSGATAGVVSDGNATAKEDQN